MPLLTIFFYKRLRDKSNSKKKKKPIVQGG